MQASEPGRPGVNEPKQANDNSERKSDLRPNDEPKPITWKEYEESGAPKQILISVSQVTTWRECERKWAWKYIAKIQTEQTAAQKLGDEIEKEQLQPYLLEGRAFQYTTNEGKKRDSAEIAATALAYLPSPKTPGLEMQRHFVIPSPTRINGAHGGVFYQGYIDLYHADSGVFPGFSGFEGFGVIPGVCDFKSTKDLKWRKKEKDLLIDPQANMYAFRELFEYRKTHGVDAPAVDLGWIYMQTQGTRKADRTHVRVYPDHVAAQFEAIDKTGQEVAEARRAGDLGKLLPLDLPPNPDLCEAYGGCPYRDKCNLSPAQIIDALATKADRLLSLKKKEEDLIMQGIPNDVMGVGGSPGGLSLLDTLKAKKAAETGAAPPVQQTLTAPIMTPVTAAAPAPVVVPIAPTTAPAPQSQIVGVAEDGTNVYTHQLDKYTYVGQAADGRAVYRLNATPSQHVPVVAQPIAAPLYAGTAQPVAAQAINPPESLLPPAPIADASKPKRGRPRKTEAAPGASASTVANIDASSMNLEDAYAFAKALRAGCDAFLAVLEAPE